MSRSARLMDLVQALRRRRRPVSAAVLARELDVSLRTIYRDIETLIGQGAAIVGEAGVGYVLRAGYELPPLMFDEAEIEALVLGARWVMQQEDEALAAAARDALAKIAAVLPDHGREQAEGTGLYAGPQLAAKGSGVDVQALREAMRAEHKLRIAYRDSADSLTERVVWPIALAFFDRVRVVAAWCELRRDFRHFRLDRIVRVADTGERYPRRRRSLMAEWRVTAGVPEQF